MGIIGQQIQQAPAAAVTGAEHREALLLTLLAAARVEEFPSREPGHPSALPDLDCRQRFSSLARRLFVLDPLTGRAVRPEQPQRVILDIEAFDVDLPLPGSSRRLPRSKLRGVPAW